MSCCKLPCYKPCLHIIQGRNLQNLLCPTDSSLCRKRIWPRALRMGGLMSPRAPRQPHPPTKGN
ncbi:hypothetical protein AAFF_G00176270 [Aldrovandia affinis]|uniref:Uncharacterized protein n=1 Tax=Aldrovandia affinis TaxID=143900 RepID=A0AAD7W7G5_9TELE|nr:hypothetical protein AAFF_G00176270 [Aldrovandia affinis]